jgi:hypothetical protein
MPNYNLSDIPHGSKGYRARNGIAAQLYRYLKSSTKPSSGKLPPGKAVCVPVPHTTSAEAFRVYITNYLRNRKGMLVSTSFKTKSKTELLVWIREPAASAVAALGKRVEVALDQLGIVPVLAPLWPPGKTSEYPNDPDAPIEFDAEGVQIIHINP